MRKKYQCWRKNLDNQRLLKEIKLAQEAVNMGESRISALEREPEPDDKELRRNRVLLRAMLAHLRLLRYEAETRGLKS